MKILLTNDDGINSEGLYSLYREAKKLGDVTIVAPDAEQSAVGHAITLSQPLRVKEIMRNRSFYGYAVNGTPADCVKIGVRAVMKSRPDIIISGINLGPNLGTDVIYSGTVSAATEARILGVPSFAISLATYKKPDYEYAASFARRLIRVVVRQGLPKDTLLNVNVPPVPEGKVRGVKITHQSKSRFIEVFDKRKDPRERTYYWLTGEMAQMEDDGDADDVAIKENYISITPIHFDMTDYEYLKELKRKNILLC
ncbi:MAG: 5'/3'-nucleotidase SurE [Candidatus Omnitrophica bacterium]|nr:5'/3'-nucleotidase SurE [Candidatus Omnitrophota bacterium]